MPAWSVVIFPHFWQIHNNQSSSLLHFFCLHVFVTGSGHQTQKNAHPLPKTRSSPAEPNDQLQPDFHGSQVGLSGDGLRINCRHPLDRFLASYLDKIEPGTNNYYNGIFGRPSFPQFVDVMLKKPGEGWDEHWAPISSLCPPCVRWGSQETIIRLLLSTNNHQISAQVHCCCAHGNIFRGHGVYNPQVTSNPICWTCWLKNKHKKLPCLMESHQLNLE